jgi:hypothetical protein
MYFDGRVMNGKRCFIPPPSLNVHLFFFCLFHPLDAAAV